MTVSDFTTPITDVAAGDARARQRRLIVVGCASWLLYAALVVLSSRFTYGTPPESRPIPLLLGLLAVLFVLYLVGLRLAVRIPDCWPIVLAFSLAFRVLVLFSQPILEVDAYRYVWDGHAAAAGVNPYRYAPADVIAASATDASAPDELRELIRLRDTEPGLSTILSRVHFSELTTPYPPVSQLVFTAAAMTSPSGSSAATRLLVMKAWIVAFDVVALLLVGRLLRLADKPIGLTLAYGWCPLVIKEFANSGHLDSIAVCLTLLALAAALRGRMEQRSRQATAWGLLSAIGLGAATAAKLYPLVLVPLLVLDVARRNSYRAAAITTTAFLIVTAGSLAPMLSSSHASATVASAAVKPSLMPPPIQPAHSVNGESHAPLEVLSQSDGRPAAEDIDGLRAFLARWRMNDFLFLLLEANLVPAESMRPDDCQPWFAFTPESWRNAVVRPIIAIAKVDARAAGFVAARSVTLAVFLVLALRWALRAAGSDEPDDFLQAAFLTLAWFLLLAPTINPWYWTWALPLVPFARFRSWLSVSGLLLLYYSRFWFGAHWPDSGVPGSTCSGEAFFDNVVVWFEFGPLWLLLIGEQLIHGRAERSLSSD